MFLVLQPKLFTVTSIMKWMIRWIYSYNNSIDSFPCQDSYSMNLKWLTYISSLTNNIMYRLSRCIIVNYNLWIKPAISSPYNNNDYSALQIICVTVFIYSLNNLIQPMHIWLIFYNTVPSADAAITWIYICLKKD